ncbi:MAG: glycosyltransferase family 2 protein [Prevotellaceae bacterium]|jgi:GT2 family glycosyltransferase|nr:glycosyltransferase family 2 protein [Prevotellaceae bacterium]
MKIFAIIVTYNGMRDEWIPKCIGSLRQYAENVQVVAIDNGSADGAVEFIKREFPQVKVFENGKNLGFGGANNIGIRYALEQGADFVLLLNQDAWLIRQNTVNELVRICSENPEFGIISPVHLNKAQNSIEKLLLKRFVLLNKVGNWCEINTELVNDLYFKTLKDIYATKYVNAAAWFIPRATLETLGGFDPTFFHYGEDDNYLNRLFYNGLQLGICPKLSLVHDNERPRPLYESREQEVLWLIEFTNINKKINIEKEIKNCRQKIFTNTLKMNKKRANYWRELLAFLQKNKAAILESRKTNMKKGKNWL